MKGIATNLKSIRSRWSHALLAIVFFTSLLFANAPVAHAELEDVAARAAAAQAKAFCLRTGAVPTNCIPDATADYLEVATKDLKDATLKIIAVKSVYDIATYVANRLAYEAAVFVANGGAGQGPLFYAEDANGTKRGILVDVAGQAFADLSDISKEWFGLDLCVPPNPLIRMSIQLSLKQSYQPVAPRCDFNDVSERWGQIVTDAGAMITNDKNARDKFLFNKLAEGLRPGNNELGATIGLLQLTNEKAQKDAQLKVAEMIGSKSIGGIMDVKDFITGKVKTPASIVNSRIEQQLTNASDPSKNAIDAGDLLACGNCWAQVGMFAASTFTNTLTSQLMNRIYSGLFDVKPTSSDPFNLESLGVGGDLNATKLDFASVFTSSPIRISDYSFLANFTVCPTQSIGNRSIDTCVIDAQFASILTRSASQQALTVQEAMDQGFLDGNWPLISSKNIAANQDRLCYTYGFCYGNLVKLRKARVVSIGWEIAAEKNSLTAPKTLKEVVAGFHDCNAQGQMDTNHPWCHLIDPNWVLKAPETQCRATVNGEIRSSNALASRQTACADAPSCIGEDNSGTCTQGFGYCVQEKNIWRVRGDECPAQYATCLTFKNTTTGKSDSLLLNTVNNANCSKQNAGCAWNKTTKTADASGAFQWLTGSATYSVSATSNIMRYSGATATTFSYQDRLFTTHNAKKCDASQAGCTELYVKGSNLGLNLVQNGSFEKDEDQNLIPDGWTFAGTGTPFLKVNGAVNGTTVAQPTGQSQTISQQVSVSPGGFYTFSVFASDDTENGAYLDAKIELLTSTGTAASIEGLSYSNTTCALVQNTTNALRFSEDNATATVSKEDGWKRLTCTFTAPANVATAQVTISGQLSFDPQYDAVQLESGEVATNFGDGYNVSSPTKAFLKLAPAYLGCRGLSTDPKECADYAQVCTQQDVGCNLYSPTSSVGPAVPAIASALDACPNECVGYESYRQEGTKYEPAKFPVAFIADKAAQCTASAVGCDGFTKLGTNGGESQEYYTNLRSCVTPAMTSENDSKKQATYFTWEGSDSSGYQLRTWQLLQSNRNAAPCVTPDTQSEDVICADPDPVPENLACNEHSDIFTNPDCREFFDGAGALHYRLFSETVTVDAACTVYRKDTSSKTDCESSGGFWTDQGFCRYFGLQKESASCSASENGCREYTGGAGRNATTILSEVFEEGTTGVFETLGNASIAPSNDSVSSGGRSLRVFASDENGAGAQTNETILETNLAKGKVYTAQFWAKGNGTISVGFKHAGNNGTSYLVQKMNLTTGWKAYDVGPINTDTLNGFDENARLFFTTENGKEFFIDNINLIQAEEKITRIKDSWVTPASCDQSPNGAVSPQYYLGCKAYADRKGENKSFYQFSRICSEEVIGCSAYYNTQNSDSAYGQLTNARCVNLTGTPAGTLPGGKAVSQNTACTIAGTTYCTISAGQNYCVFSTKESFITLPLSSSFGVVLGPEAVVTPQDQVVYLVDNGKAQCAETFKGCREVGVPTYTQDLSAVTAFTSAYIIDNPNDYANILCENQGLFCEEFASTKDGNFYFKDPMNKTCEYKTSVSIGGKTFSGWFRTGKSEPCYWADGTAPDNDGIYKPNTKDTAYLNSGDQARIWRNGDTAYSGWVGTCESSANRCMELLDATDTSPENFGRGKSYFVINNDKLSENTLSSTEKCNGKVGQKGGCALFNNTTVSQLKYNASASYVLSLHADLLLNKPKNTLVDPISCTQTGGGIFQISADTAKELNAQDLGGFSTPHAVTDLQVNLCARRCYYDLEAGDELLSPSAKAPTSSGGYWNERSCLFDTDCPALDSKLQKGVKGACRDVEPATHSLSDDANTVLKVGRDRTCAAWLACDSSRTAWDPQSNKYIQICDSVNLCTQSGTQGDQASCQAWTARDPIVMSAERYSARDVSWAGTDYAGYQIPNQLPIERLSQFNLNPKKWCENNKTKSCETKANCLETEGDCVEATPDYRLVHNAGPCDGGNSSACTVGFCKTTGVACSSNANCTGDGNKCVIGYCQQRSTTNCSTNADCTSLTATPVCDAVQKVCVDKALDAMTAEDGCSGGSGSCSGTKVCATAATTSYGQCWQNRCLTDIRDTNGDGFTEPLQINADNVQSCRGYPEIDSPFPQKVVKLWKVYPYDSVNKKYGDKAEYKDLLALPNQATARSTASQFVAGYDGSKTCTPYVDKNGNTVISDECINSCGYTKALYAKGSEMRYYPMDTQKLQGAEVPQGFCVGGENEGMTCESDAGCLVVGAPANSVQGTCQLLTATNSMFGWQGYCLEKDTSIQLNGSTNEKDQACLTWLPVDQLSGSTDLYGKETSAGYQIASDTHFCAQPDVAWNLPTSTGFACAESSGGCSNESGQSFFKDEDEDDAASNVYCPKGYFAVVEPCGDNATEPGGEPLCSEDDEQGFTYSNWDNDYPYFCVPEGSKKPPNADGAVGSSCLNPQQAKDTGVQPFTSLTPMFANQNAVDIYYFTNSDDWDKARTYYADCSLKGVFDVAAKLGKEPFQISSSGSVPGGSDDDGYRYLKFNFNEYAVCRSVVQVGLAGPSGNLNAAWTNRVWQSSDFKTTTNSYTEHAGYGVTAEPQSFGQIKGGIDQVGALKSILMCGGVMAKADGSCAAPNVLSSPVQARAYSMVALELQEPTGFTGICKPSTGTKDCNPGYAPGICNLLNVKCIGASKCIAEVGKSGKCDVGTMAGQVCFVDSDCSGTCANTSEAKSCKDQGGECVGTGFCAGSNNACSNDNDCITKKCVENPKVSKGKYAIDDGHICIDKNQSFGALSVSSAFSQSDAKARLALIFAQVYELFEYDDSIDRYVDQNISSTNVWFWDNRATANGANPPVITAVEQCIGTSCIEGKKEQFSLNGISFGDVEGTGSKHINMTFYVHADSNQMPLRKIVVDWGDDFDGVTPDKNPWPNGSQGGSNDVIESNFYKNHRGLNGVLNPPKEICTSAATEFGHAPEACSSSYVLFSHDYVCSTSQLNALVAADRRCGDVDQKTGSIVTSPCFETDENDKYQCVFQPRVHAKDNWGWCTGYCDANPAGGDTTNSCYGETECNIAQCPGGDQCQTSGKIIDPWTYFDGKIKIKPVQ